MASNTSNEKDESTHLVPTIPYGALDSVYHEYQKDAASVHTHHTSNSETDHQEFVCCWGRTVQVPSIRRLAMTLSLYCNVLITLSKLIAYVQTLSLSVLAALLDSVLDVVSQLVLNYTEKHSSLQRSSAAYPAGASRLEPIGVLTCAGTCFCRLFVHVCAGICFDKGAYCPIFHSVCFSAPQKTAALMGMASFEVLKESALSLLQHKSLEDSGMSSFWNMTGIVILKLGLLHICNLGAHKKIVRDSSLSKHVVQLADPTLEALAQDHWNDSLSNLVAAVALLCVMKNENLWYIDPLGAILISIYIIYSWYMTGKEQIEHLTGKRAPEDFIEELVELANDFDDRIVVDIVRAYHFGPKFLVEIEIVMDKTTLLFESHDLGMDLQYEIEGRDEVERCFVHIDYESRPYDEHVVSKVPELREKYVKSHNSKMFRSTQSV